MTNSIRDSGETMPKSCVIALHSSLGSGRQWTRLIETLDDRYAASAPDLSGYGDHKPPFQPLTSLAEEVKLLGKHLNRSAGPIHLVGHSYGGAVAFKIATASPFASRVRSLTLIEPVLPTLLKDDAKDRRLHDRFADLAQQTYADLWNGLFVEALDKFCSFWNGSASQQTISTAARIRMIEHVEKLAFDFAAVLAEEDVAAAAAEIGVPTLLLSGGHSPYLTQRITERLASIIPAVETMHLPDAGHMLPFSHPELIIPKIVRHVRRCDDRVKLSLVTSLDGSSARRADRAMQPASAATSAG
jgi:pimeloyl-ACP methyl ester carboxylesterase